MRLFIDEEDHGLESAGSPVVNGPATAAPLSARSAQQWALQLLSPRPDSSAEPFSWDSDSLLQPLGLCMLALCTLFCVCANLLTLVVLLRCSSSLHRSSSRTSSLYVLSLSLADFGIGGCVMPLMFVRQLGEPLRPAWLCQSWQLADLVLSTVSLYSICAISLDRVWNLEEPLRVFTRSRRRARRLMLCIWALPALIWASAYLLLVPPSAGAQCLPTKQLAEPRIFWVALPVLYVPAAVLIVLFVRISFVVHRHLKFLREHAQLGSTASCPVPAPFAAPASAPNLGQLDLQPSRPSAVSSPHQMNGARFLLRTPESPSPTVNSRPFGGPAKNTFDSICSAALSGRVTTSLRTPPKGNSSPLLMHGRKNGAFNGWRERRAPPIDEQQQWRASPVILVHEEEEEGEEEERELEREIGETSQCGEAKEKTGIVPPKSSFASRTVTTGTGGDSDDSSLSSAGKKDCLLRKLSASLMVRRWSTSRWSMVAFSESLTELLQREGIAQQVRAAKAVSLILCCFLLCWFPLLLAWPLRLFAPQLVSERSLRWCLWLNYSCSTFNPLLYALSNPKIRSALRNCALACKLLGKLEATQAHSRHARRSNNNSGAVL